MKVLLSLSIILAISGGFVSNAEFTSQIQDLRVRFQGIHLEMDLYLRNSRWNVSDLLQKWNREILSHHAILTTNIQDLRYEVYDEILDRVDELGNQNQCLINLDSRLVAAGIASSEDAKQCAQAAYDLISETIRDNYFDLINLIQRESSTGQHVQFYGMGANNVITNQEGVVSFLEGVWEEVESGWPNIWSVWVDEEEAKLNAYHSIGISNSNACIASVFSGYSTVVNVIRGEIADCS